jgi:hypothetical protein
LNPPAIAQHRTPIASGASDIAFCVSAIALHGAGIAFRVTRIAFGASDIAQSSAAVFHGKGKQQRQPRMERACLCDKPRLH